MQSKYTKFKAFLLVKMRLIPVFINKLLRKSGVNNGIVFKMKK